MTPAVSHDLITSAGPIMIALTGMLVPVGATARFVWNRIETRFVSVEAKLAECQARDAAKDGKMQALAVSITLLIPVVQRTAPRDPVLSQVRSLLRSTFRADHSLPGDMADLLDRLRDAEDEYDIANR